MRTKDVPKGWLTLGQVAQKLKIANNTIKRWYQWYESPYNKTELVLPKYHLFDKLGTKFFREKDIVLFRKFQYDISSKGEYYGVMSDFIKVLQKKTKWVSVSEGLPKTFDDKSLKLYLMEDGAIYGSYNNITIPLTVTHWAEVKIRKYED